MAEALPDSPADLTRVVTGSGAVTPVVKISGRFVQDLAVRPGDPRGFATVGDFVARIRELVLAEIDRLGEAMREKGLLAAFPFLIQDMREAAARTGIHGADGKHLAADVPAAALADLLGDVPVLYICVDDHAT
jgi:hypothetical protein